MLRGHKSKADAEVKEQENPSRSTMPNKPTERTKKEKKTKFLTKKQEYDRKMVPFFFHFLFQGSISHIQASSKQDDKLRADQKYSVDR